MRIVLLGLFVFLYNGIYANNSFIDSIYHFIENPAVFELGQEPHRTYYIPETSISLNGKWKFALYDNPEGLPSDCYKTEFSDKDFSQITVPSNWEMEGYGDRKFRNMSLSFYPNPPFVPKEYNPTGCYRRDFVIPDSWRGREIFLRMEKVASASFIWINGKQVGFNEGAHEPAEYNITDYLKKGRNQITVVVTKFSDGYYLEDQDYWRLAGIFDDVTVYSTPKLRIFDWHVVTDLDSDYVNAALRVNVDLKKYGKNNVSAVNISAVLFDNNGKKITTLTSWEKLEPDEAEEVITLEGMVKNPSKWTAETPVLYDMKLDIKDSKGRVIDVVTQKIGFKETEIKDGVFYLNGRAIKLNAVNSHMQHPQLGHWVNEVTIRTDMELLKKFNFNTVRTSHYPPTNRYLQLANEYGLYIIDEAGTEAHATEYLSNDPSYEQMYRERVRAMVLRDRNYPCVLFWSAGNESGEGVNIAHAIEEGKKYDTMRSWMYGGNAFSHYAEDIIGPRYPFPLEHEVRIGIPGILDMKSDVRPSFLDEYLSVAGNGGGSMDEYWENFYRYPRMLGGAIWDFVSPGLEEKVKRVKDFSVHDVLAHIMGNAKIRNVDGRKCLDLNGQDQWVEIYQDSCTDITSKSLSLYCSVKPRRLKNASNYFISKGNNQFGLRQLEDSLIFYIYTDKRHELKIALPDDWWDNWHDVLAVYHDGVMSVIVDKHISDKHVGNNAIMNFPYPINIGRNAELEGQEINGYLCNALIDKVVISSYPLSLGDIYSDEQYKSSVLCLGFDEYYEEGRFYSYGIGARTYGCIWPDRKVQPEMWQFKHSTRPIQCELYSLKDRKIRIYNRNSFLNASVYNHKWVVEVDGEKISQGKLNLDIPPSQNALVEVPFTISDNIDIKNSEVRLFIISSLKENTLWADKGFEVACSQIDLYTHPIRDIAIECNREIDSKALKENDSTIVVKYGRFEYSWNKRTGVMFSAKLDGKELFKKGIELNVWRAPLANQLDDWNAHTAKSVNWKIGQGWRMVSEFYSLGIDKLFQVNPVQIDAYVANGVVHVFVKDIRLCGGSGQREKQDLYIEGLAINGFINKYHYKVYSTGEILLEHQISTQGKMPLFLPRLGVQLELTDDLRNIEWYGRGPYENYPDRKTGSMVSKYRNTVDKMFEPYLIPQDCALRTDNRWVEITNKDKVGLRWESDKLFNFNVYPYTTENLSKAWYPFQLKKIAGVTFNFDYETSGVGCTCRGIFNDYKVYPKGGIFTIKITPLFGK